MYRLKRRFIASILQLLSWISFGYFKSGDAIEQDTIRKYTRAGEEASNAEVEELVWCFYCCTLAPQVKVTYWVQIGGEDGVTKIRETITCVHCCGEQSARSAFW